MTCNRKALLMGLTALAISAIGASSASANFTTEHTQAKAFTNVNIGNTVITTEPDGAGSTAHQIWDVPGNGAITCNAIDFEGTVSLPTSTSITLKGRGATPLTSCNFLGLAATVELNGCGFQFNLPSTAAIVGCNAGKDITFSAAGCTLHTPLQDLPESHLKYRNLGSGGNDMFVTAEVVATKITSTATGAGCITSGHITNGTLTTANTIIKGHEDPTGAQKPITVH